MTHLQRFLYIAQSVCAAFLLIASSYAIYLARHRAFKRRPGVTAATTPPPSTPVPPIDPPAGTGPYREPAVLGVDPVHVLAAATRVPKACPTCGADLIELSFAKQFYTYPKEQGGDERFHGTWSESARYECNRNIWWSEQRGGGSGTCPTVFPLCKREGCGVRTERGPFCNSVCATRWAEENVGKLT